MPLFKKLLPKLTIPRLFRDGSNGGWYDPSDLWGGTQRLVRRNLLTSTATMATQTKAVAALSHTLYIKGTGSVTLSGAATGTLNGTGASDRVSLTFTPTAGNLTLTVSGSVTEGHLTETRTADHTYQAITDWTTEQYAYAASTQYPWLRRNLIAPTYGNTFSTITLCTQTNGVTGSDGRNTWSTFAFTAGAGYALRATGIVPVIGKTYTFSFKLYSSNKSNIVLNATAAGAGGESIKTPLTITSTPTYYAVTLTFAGPSYTGMTFGLDNRASSGGNESAGTIYLNDIQVTVSDAIVPFQLINTTWDAQYAADEAAAGHVPVLFQDRAGTNPCNADGQTVGKVLDKSGRGNTATAAADANRPLLKLDGNGYWYTAGDGVDDALVAQFTTNQGTACAEYVSGASSSTETTGITINTTRSIHGQTANYGTVIRVTPVPEPKRTKLLKILDKLAGR